MYPLTIYTYRGLKDWGDGTYQAARAIGPIIIVRPDKRDDAGLLAHEVEHVKQWAIFSVIACVLIAFIGYHVGDIEVAGMLFLPWSMFPAGFGAFSLLDSLVPEFRLWAEVSAYQVQAKHYADDRLPLFADFISKRYGLKITTESALQLLMET